LLTRGGGPKKTPSRVLVRAPGREPSAAFPGGEVEGAAPLEAAKKERAKEAKLVKKLATYRALNVVSPD
jgi:hypothetical protein